MHREALKQLRTVADRLGMLHDHSDRSITRAVRNLDPVARIRSLRRQVDAQRRDRLTQRILIQFGDQQVIVFHSKRKLLHVNVVQEAVLAAEKQKRAGRVERRYGRDVLRLPHLRQRVPHADLATRAERDQL